MFLNPWGILGQNERNLFLEKHVSRQGKKLADSKIKTREFLHAYKVPTPDILKIIRSQQDLASFSLKNVPLPFVIKPDNASGGKGILLVHEKKGEQYRVSGGKLYSSYDLLKHIRNILDGYYSLSSSGDKVLLESKIELHHAISLFGEAGLPDIRLLVYKYVPIMAMIRIPTYRSKGIANVHQGGLIAGLDIGNGAITGIFTKDKKARVEFGDIRGVVLPEWEKVLEIGVKTQQATKIPYLACDIVLDKNKGPLILEINARGGLEIQNANRIALGKRIQKLENVSVDTPEKGIRLGRDLFGRNIDAQISELAGKPIVGMYEYLLFFKKKSSDITHRIQAFMNTGQEDNYISRNYAQHLLSKKILGKVKSNVRLSFGLLNNIYTQEFVIRDNLPDAVHLGSSFLKTFLVDISKYKPGELPYDERFIRSISRKNIQIYKSLQERMKKLEANIYDTQKRLLFFGLLTPNNRAQEKQIFCEKKGEYIPLFEYDRDPKHIALIDKEQKFLTQIDIPDIPFKNLYEKKRQELVFRCELFRAFFLKNTKKITFFSGKLYGNINSSSLEFSKQYLKKLPEKFPSYRILAHEEVEQTLKKFLRLYQLSLKLVWRENTSARMSVGNHHITIRSGSMFSHRELRSSIAHEIETHALRRFNANAQSLRLFRLGGSAYLETEEGLAIYNQMRFLDTTMEKFFSIFRLYQSLHAASSVSYSELIYLLKELYGEMNYEKIFDVLARIKRGWKRWDTPGVFLKDVIYVHGYQKILEFVQQGGKIERLYFSKCALSDLSELDSLSSDLQNILFSDKNQILPFFL